MNEKRMKSKMYCRYFFIIFILIASAFSKEQLLDLTTIPTAGLLEHRSYSTDLKLLPGGEILFGFNIGLFGRLELGGSYGGSNVLGYGYSEMNSLVGFSSKIRVFDENIQYPGIVIGINTQGFGGYSEQAERYRFKSIGPYIVTSKNWWALGGNLSAHLGFNYSLETKDESSPSVFLGIDKDFDNIFGINIEYDFALADSKKDDLYGEGNGYLNSSIWWFLSDNFRFEILFIDILSNSKGNKSFGRGLGIVFYDSF